MTRILPAAIFFVSIFVIGSGVAEGKRKGVHVVKSGQTLWSISRTYGCKVEEIKEANDLGKSMIRPGQTLKIPPCDGKKRSSKGDRRHRETLVLTHYVMKGDTLGRIAKRYDTTVKKIRRRNRLKNDMIRPGQKLRIAVGTSGKGRPVKGQSVGYARDGKLANGMQLPTGRSYYRRRPHRAWGTNHAIHHIRRVASAVRGRYPKVHKLSIGDISSRKGGKLAQHKSHQSGRDADIGFYFKKRPKGYPRTFIRGNAKNLDVRATWLMLKLFADSRDVEKMFLNYEIQEIFYKYAKKRGMSKRKLKKYFQYPNGKGASHGIMRHDPGHDSHVHVRFRCPKGDKGCKD